MADKQSPEHVTREMPALELRAEFTPSSVDAEKRTAEVVFSTGARVLRGGFWSDPYWEELSLDPRHVRLGRLRNGAPLLADHNGSTLDSVLGVVEAAEVDGKRGTAVVRFARDEASEKVFQKVRDGILQNISVGYRVHRMETTEKGDPEAKKWPVRMATDWEPFEVSVVPMGADDGAGFRGAEGQKSNPCIIESRTGSPHEEPNMSEKTNEPTPKAADTVAAATREAAERREMQAQADAAEVRKATERALAEERAREVEIRSLCREHKLGDTLADKLIADGASINDVRKAVLDHMSSRGSEGPSGLHGFIAGEDVREKFVRGAVASILERTGHVQAIEAAKQNKRVGHLLKDVATDAGEFRGMRLSDLAWHALEMRGVSTRSLHGELLVKRALEFRGDSGFNTTSDFAVLLETAVNKVFLGQYALAPVTWPEWCGKKSVQDFRTSTFYRPGSFGTLDTVTEAGEIKHKNIPDGAKATLTPATKGNIIGITRRAIVNDDLGAFRDLASALGTAAAFTIEADAFAMITANSGLGTTQSDSQPLFYSTRNNIGTTGAMSVTTLDSIRAKMALQKDASSNMYLNLRPAIWLGPVELEGQAKVFNESAGDPTDNKSQAVPNRVRGLFQKVIGSPYLSASSAVRHYGLADPGMFPAFAVGFIDGNESPVIASEQSFGYDGVQMKIVLDYGTAILDYRPAVTCAGQ